MELFWTNMDYVGSDSSGLGSVWIYSGPIKFLNQNFWSLLAMNPDQIILVWDQHGFILGQYHTDGFILGRYNHEPNKCGFELCPRHTPRGSASESTDMGVETDAESLPLLKPTHPCPLAHKKARFATRYERRQGDPNRRRFQRLFNLANGIAEVLRAGQYLGCRSYQIMSTRKRFWKRFRKAKLFTIRDQKV